MIATETIYYVCDKCGHIEPRPDWSDPSYRCENCGGTGEQRGYALLTEALDRSEAVNPPYPRVEP